MMMKDIPVYKYPASHAREHDELPAYRASSKANMACKEAIETAIRDYYRDNRLGSDAVKQVVEQFGYDRNCYLVVNSHPGLTDLFLSQARKAHALEQQKTSVRDKLKKQPEPTSLKLSAKSRGQER